MKRVLLLLSSCTFLVGCPKGPQGPEFDPSTCAGYTRTRVVDNQMLAYTVPQRIGSKLTGQYNLQPLSTSYRSYSDVPLTPCNLPVFFQKDSLPVVIRGYYLTYPGFDAQNTTSLPFEIAKIELRN